MQRGWCWAVIHFLYQYITDLHFNGQIKPFVFVGFLDIVTDKVIGVGQVSQNMYVEYNQHHITDKWANFPTSSEFRRPYIRPIILNILILTATQFVDMGTQIFLLRQSRGKFGFNLNAYTSNGAPELDLILFSMYGPCMLLVLGVYYVTRINLH